MLPQRFGFLLLGLPLGREHTLLAVADLGDAGRIDNECRHIREIDAIGAVLLRDQPRLFCKEGRTADFQHANTFVHLEQVSAHAALFGRADASRARMAASTDWPC